ncbi:MAG: PEP-CTERM sorting domain-containing protein, partial [Armatimonadota bacterium]
RDQLDYKVSIAGGKIDLMFVNMWPDKQTRDGFMQTNLGNTPTLLFTHDQPYVEAKHFSTTDPVGQKNYEGLITTVDGNPPSANAAGIATREASALSDYLLAHPQIKGYFHGNDNQTEFYKFGGTDVFRVDSPMKGNLSGADDSLLSFQVVTIDTDAMQMVSREFLWNQGTNGVWGVSSNIVLVPEPGSLCVMAFGGVMLLLRRRA